MDEQSYLVLEKFVRKVSRDLPGFDDVRAGEYNATKVHAEAALYSALNKEAKAIIAANDRLQQLP